MPITKVSFHIVPSPSQLSYSFFPSTGGAPVGPGGWPTDIGRIASERERRGPVC
jgi:hypothetical protein